MRVWDEYPVVASRVRRTHEEIGLYGHHDWVHAFRVGEVAQQVAWDEWGGKRLSHLAGLAGLCHNADRLLQKKLRIGRRGVEPELVTFLVADWLRGVLNQDGVDLVTDAVLKHDGRNSPEDSEVSIALMDADRVVNLDVDLFIRSGQRFHNDPAVDYRHYLNDPEATYQNPKSVLRDIAYALDWVDPKSPVCVRTQLGKKMVESRLKIFRTFFDALLNVQLAEEGIHPYPFTS